MPPGIHSSLHNPFEVTELINNNESVAGHIEANSNVSIDSADVSTSEPSWRIVQGQGSDTLAVEGPEGTLREIKKGI